MGVPKFFRYISERYPCLSEKLKEYQIPEFDNLYLDMNGIIHNCSHPNDADVSFRITEETIFKNIFHYIEILFRIIQPQKLFFMAVDGVAPRAKINQQRGRRFRSAKDAEVQEAKARAKGEEIPKEARFDSNCITPGTVFMSKLNEQLKYFINYKMSTDKLWQKCKIILSGSEVPGEGEHKIMDYIRYMKAQPDYEGNTRHCLYGLDADLIMLGLCSHEPHFSLLREEVKFGKAQKKILTPEETNFCLLHLSLMREYLEHEFSPVKAKLDFKFDIEKIIDDWILMGFLVGNDFIPHLPNLQIENNALPILYNAYMEVLPTLNGYINESGNLNLERFEKFMEKLGELDMESFDEIYADLKYFESKTGRRLNDSERNSKSSPDENASPKRSANLDLKALIMATESELGESEEGEDDSDEESDMHLEFVQHKRDYYMNKMEYANVDAEIMRSQAEGYIRAIQWNLHYYYNGCCSWSWYYPHHYAPFISDIKNFKDLKLEFDIGTPFLPFEQLLAVLPAASKNLLPTAYHGLMTEENSPIIEYYPLDFKTDLNGKKQEWEAVVLIPLINEKNLLKAMEPCNAKLTEEERRRNRHGPMCVFTFSGKDEGIYHAPEYFPSIRSFTCMKLVNREDILVPIHKLVKGLCKGVQLSVYYPGFPTLQHIPHTSSLAKAKVKVFEQPSRRENMILTVLPKEDPDLDDLANRWVGKTVFIGWPHLLEALVTGVQNSKTKISIVYPQPKSQQTNNGPLQFTKEANTDQAISAWNMFRKNITENYKGRLGIDVGDIDVIVYACPMVGRQYVYSSQGKMTLEKQWTDNPMTYAYQVVLYDIKVHNPDFIQYTSIQDVFKPKEVCFMLGHPHYGAMGEVVEPGVDLKTSRVKVAMRVMQEPNFDRVRQMQSETRLRYMPGNIAAQRLGISSHLLSRITGTIFVISGDGTNTTNASKHNIGLNLKFNKKNEEVPGFTKKDHNGVWLYSTKSIDYINRYMDKFPELFERLEQNLLSSDMFLRDHLFPENGGEGIDATVGWLKDEQKALKTETRACGYEELESEVVQCIEKEIDENIESQKQTSKTVIMQVKPHLLYKPGLNSSSIPPDSKAMHRLFDRIICVRENFTVPLGYKGTITGIQKGENPQSYVYEVLFDKAFAGGFVLNNSSPHRSCRLAPTDFINISYGLQIENKNSNKVNAPAPGWRQQDQTTNSNESWRQQQQQQQSPNHRRWQNNQQQQQQSPNHTRNTPNNWRQQPPQATPRPPDPAILNSFYPGFTSAASNQNKRMSNEQQKSQFPAAPIVLQRQQQPQEQQPDGGRKPIPLIQALQKSQQQQQQQLKQQLQQQKQQKQQGPTEFQALWNELHKIQKPLDMANKQAAAPVSSERMNQPPLSATKDSPQDPSAFLKAMLKISDDSSINKPSVSTSVNTSSSSIAPTVNKPSIAATSTSVATALSNLAANIKAVAPKPQLPKQQQLPPRLQQQQQQLSPRLQQQQQQPPQQQQQQQQPPPQMQQQLPSAAPVNKPVNIPFVQNAPKPTDNTPPLVQQLFDQARRAEIKSGKNIWYCSQLLSYFQLLNTGFPRYTYCTNKDGLVCSQITLPDLRTFYGDFCQTHAEAVENTAKKVYEELNLDKAPTQGMRPSPLRPPPAQQWFPPPRNMVPGPPPPVIQQQQQPQQPLGNMKPMLPAGFPQAPMMQMPMPKWTPVMQQAPRFATGPPMPMNTPVPQMQQQGRFPQPPLSSCNNVGGSGGKLEQGAKKPTPFVPLQAQKKTRNVPNKQSTQQQQHQGDNKQQQLKQERQEKRDVQEKKTAESSKPKDSSPKDVKQERMSGGNKNTDSANQNSQSQIAAAPKNISQKTAKQQKRSRVAAKFLAGPAVANGSDKQ